jgi:hypothetical protein
MIRLKIKSHLFLTLNNNNSPLNINKGETIVEVQKENLESIKNSFKQFKISFEEINPTEEVKNEIILDEEFKTLLEEAKNLQIKGCHLIKDKEKLIAKINEFKSSKQEINPTEEVKQ